MRTATYSSANSKPISLRIHTDDFVLFGDVCAIENKSMRDAIRELVHEKVIANKAELKKYHRATRAKLKASK